MTLSAPYRQKNYMGEYAAETGGGSALEFIQANKWDSSGDGAGTPRAGMMFFDTAAVAMKVYSGSAWAEIGGGAQLSDLSDVGDTTVGAGRLLISDADSWESQLVGGAITLSSSGATAFNATSEASADDADLVLIYDDDAAVYKRMTRANFLSGAGASQLSDLSDVGVTTATAGRLLVADGDSWESQTISGAITMASDGGTGFIADSELTADDADLLLIYDDSESEYRRMTRANFLSGVGALPAGTGTEVQYRVDNNTFGASGVYWDVTAGQMIIGNPTQLWDAEVPLWILGPDQGYSGALFASCSNTQADHSQLLFMSNRGTTVAPTVPLANDILGEIYFGGLTTNGWAGTRAWGAIIRAKALDNYGTNPTTNFEIRTAMAGSASAAARYIIDSTYGHLFYGNGASPTLLFKVDADSKILMAPSQSGAPAAQNAWFFYDTSVHKFKFAEGGVWRTIPVLGDLTTGAGRLLISDSNSWESRTVQGAIVIGSTGNTSMNATTKTEIDDADLVLIYDASVPDYGHMTRANFLSGVGAAPGGSTPQLQYNDGAGGFAAATNVRYDSSDGVLIIGAYDDPAWSSSVYGLHVMRDGYAGINVSGASTTAAEIPIIKLTRTHGADHDNPGVIESGDGLGRINFDGTRTAAWNGQSIGVAFQAIASEAWGVSATGTKFELQTTTNATITATTRYEIDGDGDHVWYGAGNTPDERLRLENEGPILFPEISAPGTTTNRLYNTSTGLYFDGTRLDVAGISPGGSDGQIQWRDSGAFAGTDNAYWDDTNNSIVIGDAMSSSIASGYAGVTVSKTDEHASVDISSSSNVADDQAFIRLVKTRGTIALPLAIQSGDTIGSIRFMGSHLSSWAVGSGAVIESAAAETWGTGPVKGARLYLQTVNIGDELPADRYSIEGNSDHVWYGAGASPSQIMRIDAANGMLVVGEETASTVEWGGIESSANNFYGLITGVTASETSAHMPSLRLVRARGTTSSPTVPTAGYPLGDVHFFGLVSGAWNTTASAAYIKAEATETWSALTYGAKLEFSTTNTGTDGCAVRYEIAGNSDHVWYGAGNTPDERLRLENEGPILFPEISAPGTTTNRLYNTSTGLYFDGTRLDVAGASPGGSDGQIQWRDSGAFAGTDEIYWDDANDTLILGNVESNLSISGNDDWPLQIVKGPSAVGVLVGAATNLSERAPNLKFVRARNSVMAPYPVQAADVIGNILFAGVYSTIWTGQKESARLEAVSTELWSTSACGSEFSIQTCNTGTDDLEKRYIIGGDSDHIWYGAGASPSERLRLENEGPILFPEISAPGTTTNRLYNTSTGLYFDGTRLDVAGGSPGGSDGQIQWRSSGAFAGTDAAYWNDTYNTLILGSSTTQTYSNATVGLDVHRDTSAYITIGSSSGSATPDTNVAAITLIKSRGTHASPAALTAGDHIGGMHFSGIAGASLSLIDTGALIRAYATETWGSSIAGTRLAIQTINTSVYGRADRYSIEGNSDHIWYGAGASSSQIFKLDATNIYAVAPSTASPASAAEGAFFYDTTADVFKFGQGASPSWVTIPTSVPSPGGSTPQLQYNDGAGDFAAATNVRYDSDNDVLMVGPFDSMHWSYSVYGLVVSKDDWAGMMMSAASDTAATSPFIILQRVGGTHASPTVTQNTHVLGSIAWNGLRTTGWSDMAQGAAIFATASQTWEMTKAGTKFEFKTATNDTATAATRYEIDGDGGHIWYGAGTSPSEQWRIVDGYSMYQRGIATVRENAFRGVEDVSYSFMVAGENATDFVPGLSLDVGDGSPALVFHSTHDTGSFASKVAVADEDLLGVISFLGWSGATNGYTPGAHIFVYVDGTPDTSNSPARIEFYTHDSNLDGATRYAIEGSGGHVWYGVGASPSQIFKLDAINIYAVASSRAGEPSSAAEGAFFYDTTADVFKFGQGASPAWVTIGTGDVSKVGTPANDQLAVWTGDGTLEGSTDISVDSSGHMSFGATNGAALGVQNIAEEVTIPFTSGSGGIATSGNLAPADSLILAVTARVTDAPGGGATTFDVGITGSGNADELIDAVSTALNTQANSASDNDGTQLPIANGTATTLTVTTDVDVTDNDMKVRIVVWYLSLTEPTS